MKKSLMIAICATGIIQPAFAIDLTVTKADVIEGPVIADIANKSLHPLELLGEVRDSRPHWYTPRLGTKYYVYRVAENGYHYTTTKKIPKVFDPRPWKERHPLIFGAYEISRVSAGAVITGAFAWFAAKR